MAEEAEAAQTELSKSLEETEDGAGDKASEPKDGSEEIIDTKASEGDK